MSRLYIRDLMRSLVVVFIIISCGEALYYMSDTANKSSKKPINDYERPYSNYYQVEEKNDTDTTYVYY